MPRTENLSKLLEIIDKIIKNESDNWFSSQLLDKIGTSVDLKNISEHSVIKEIHEYCIEEILKTQAEEFYKDLPLEDIKDVLVIDFIKMERQRREGDFINFSLAMFQQIENIVNHLFELYKLDEKFKKDEDVSLKFKLKLYDKDIKDYREVKNPTLNHLIFEGNPKQNWKIWRPKLRVVLYYYYFNSEVTNYFVFNKEIFEHANAICQIRNMSHRGTVPTKNQKNIQLKYNENKSWSYLYFYSFLQKFIINLSANLTESKDEIKSVSSQISKSSDQDVISAKSKKKMDFKFTGQVIDLSKIKK